MTPSKMLIFQRRLWYIVFWANSLFSAWRREWISASLFALAPFGTHWFIAIGLRHLRRSTELDRKPDQSA